MNHELGNWIGIWFPIGIGVVTAIVLALSAIKKKPGA